MADLVVSTPVERRAEAGWGEFWVKRDDRFEFGGQAGGKVRSCLALAVGPEADRGLVTASARVSPQQLIVATIAAARGVPCRLHVPLAAAESVTLERSVALGAVVVAHRAGYNSVITARASADAAARGWRLIPFGMECQEAVLATAGQVVSVLGVGVRLVVPVGSGMSLSGILWGLRWNRVSVPVVGVVVGADPGRRLDRWAPPGWRSMVRLVPAGVGYHRAASVTCWGGLELDPYYEAKVIPFLEPGDLLWVVGHRDPAVNGSARAEA